MKFAEHLSAHITPEWRKQYIQYEVSWAIMQDSLKTGCGNQKEAADLDFLD